MYVCVCMYVYVKTPSSFFSAIRCCCIHIANKINDNNNDGNNNNSNKNINSDIYKCKAIATTLNMCCQSRLKCTWLRHICWKYVLCFYFNSHSRAPPVGRLTTTPAHQQSPPPPPALMHKQTDRLRGRKKERKQEKQWMFVCAWGYPQLDKLKELGSAGCVCDHRPHL